MVTHQNVTKHLFIFSFYNECMNCYIVLQVKGFIKKKPAMCHNNVRYFEMNDKFKHIKVSSIYIFSETDSAEIKKPKCKM